jgi:hypothetical protein
VPWRFSDAGRRRAWKVCHAGVRKPPQDPHNSCRRTLRACDDPGGWREPTEPIQTRGVTGRWVALNRAADAGFGHRDDVLGQPARATFRANFSLQFQAPLQTIPRTDELFAETSAPAELRDREPRMAVAERPHDTRALYGVSDAAW